MSPTGVARTHPRRALSGAALTTSFALLLGPLAPVTAATRGRPHPPAATQTPAAAGGEAQAGARGAQPQPVPPPAAPSEDTRRVRAHEPAPALGEPRLRERQPGNGRDGGRPRARRPIPAEPPEAPADAEGSGSGAQAGSGAGSVPGAGEGASEPLAAARSRRHGKGGKGVREREQRETRERAEHLKEQAEREAQSRAGKQLATPAPAAVVASAPPQPASVATPAAAAAPAAPASTTSPARTLTAPRGRTTGAHGATRRHAGASAAHGTVSGLAAAPITAGAAAVTPARGPAPAHRTAVKKAPAKAASPALIQTVTKIINVVPAAMRWIVAALIALTLALGLSSRVAARRARRLSRQRSELLEDVGLLQAALLPTLPERVGEVAASAAYQPASGPAAGGDFYDVLELADGRLGVIVGDVSGHGREALPHTTLVRYTLRAYLEAGLSPRSALQTAAPVLERQLGDVFATVVIASYEPAARRLVYASAGHPPPVVLGFDEHGRGTPLDLLTRAASPPIGAGQPTGVRQTVVALPGEALVCFHTDGLVEARVQGNLYGAERLARVLAELGPQASAAGLLERVGAEADRRPDDMAACLLHVEGAAAAPFVQMEELELDGAAPARRRLARFLLAAGLAPERVERVASEVDGSLAEHGAVVLELRPGAADPEIHLRRRNFTVLRPQSGERAHDKEVNVG